MDESVEKSVEEAIGETLEEVVGETLEETIRLDQFMKFGQLAESGGQAKQIIQSGGVLVNGEVETRRGRKLRHGDVVDFEGDEYAVEFGSESGDAVDYDEE